MKTHDQILNLIEKRPMTAFEIRQKLAQDNNRIHRNVIYRHLKRAERDMELGYFDNNDPKGQGRNAMEIIKKGYGIVKGIFVGVQWSKRSNRIYFRTIKSAKLFKRLNRLYSQEGRNDDLIFDILRNYRALESRAVYNINTILEPELVREERKKDGKDYSNEAVQRSIKSAIYDCNRTYENRDKLIKINLPEDSPYSSEEVKLFFDQIILDKWMTFFYVLDIKSMQKSSLEENKKLPTTVMMNKMFELFVRIKNSKIKI